MYSINCIQTWAISWEKKGWTKKGGEIKNLEIIKQAYYLYNNIKKDVKLSHIKAHAGFEGNELADRMTMYAIEEKSEAFVKYSNYTPVIESPLFPYLFFLSYTPVNESPLFLSLANTFHSEIIYMLKIMYRFY